MKLIIIILDSAEQDIKELRTYILKNLSLKAWHNTYAKIRESIRNLADSSESGSFPEEIEKFNMSQYRQVLSGMNRVIYEVRQDIVYIHTVVDARSDLNTFLNRRLLKISNK